MYRDDDQALRDRIDALELELEQERRQRRALDTQVQAADARAEQARQAVYRMASTAVGSGGGSLLGDAPRRRRPALMAIMVSVAIVAAVLLTAKVLRLKADNVELRARLEYTLERPSTPPPPPIPRR